MEYIMRGEGYSRNIQFNVRGKYITQTQILTEAVLNAFADINRMSRRRM